MDNKYLNEEGDEYAYTAKCYERHCKCPTNKNPKNYRKKKENSSSSYDNSSDSSSEEEKMKDKWKKMKEKRKRHP